MYIRHLYSQFTESVLSNLPAGSHLFITPRSIRVALPQSFRDVPREAENSSCPAHTFPAEVKQGDALTSCFSSYSVNKCPFHGLCSDTLSAFLCFLGVIPSFKMVPACGAEVLSRVPKCETAVLCPTEKTRVR